MRKIKVSTAIDLFNIYWPDFVEVDGSVFLASDQPNRTDHLEQNHDRTQIEAFYSHTHVEDLFKHNAGREPVNEGNFQFIDYDHPNFPSLCKLGKILAQVWFEKLRGDFPQYDFRVYYTQKDSPVVRFHRIRPDEINWIDEERYYEEIKRGEVIIYDTRNVSNLRSDA